MDRRDLLRGDENTPRETASSFCFVHLDGAEDLIARRLGARRGHYMPAGLLASQIATLEPLVSGEGITVDIGPTPEMIVAQIKQQLSALEPGDPQEVEA